MPEKLVCLEIHFQNGTAVDLENMLEVYAERLLEKMTDWIDIVSTSRLLLYDYPYGKGIIRVSEVISAQIRWI